MSEEGPKKGKSMDMREALVNEIEALYHVGGLNHVLGALTTVLIRHWEGLQRNPHTSQSALSVAYEIAQLKKARLPLSADERAAVRKNGILQATR